MWFSSPKKKISTRIFYEDRKTVLETILHLLLYWNESYFVINTILLLESSDCLNLLFYWNESYFVINSIERLGTSVATRPWCYPKMSPNVADITRCNSMLIIVLRPSKIFRFSWSLCEVINCFSCLKKNIFFILPYSKLFYPNNNHWTIANSLCVNLNFSIFQLMMM